MTSNWSLIDKPEFQALLKEKDRLKNQSIVKLFSEQPNRANDFTITQADIELDYSRHAIDTQGFDALFKIIDPSDSLRFANELLDGLNVNFTERQPALHSLFRNKNSKKKHIIVSEIQQKMAHLVEEIVNGNKKGFTGKAFTDVVNLGIGGSYLGPKLVFESLSNYRNHLHCHFVSNLDPEDLRTTLLTLQPETTLFVVCSKSFKTEETLINAQNAKNWLMKAGAKDLENNFIAITENTKAAQDFSIPAENCLLLPKEVVGRYSIWTSAGLTCALGIGWKSFNEFLSGAEAMDTHFKSASPSENLPVIMSLLEFWYRNCWNTQVHAIIPYSHNLRSLPSHLQQLVMESNGKNALASGEFLEADTASVVWGTDGINGQHSFYQFLHQGTVLCPIDFILPLSPISGDSNQHSKMVSHCLAQARALMIGRSTDESYNYLVKKGPPEKYSQDLAPHLRMPGNRPSSIISFESLNPTILGSLLALYEHKTYFSARLWGINPFDQWGVELGKTISKNIQTVMFENEDCNELDPATHRLISKWKKTTLAD